MSTETNCFKIAGLEDLRINYRLFQIVGLRRDGMDYYGNIQKIIRRLSFQMKAPVTTYERSGETFVLVPQKYGDPPNQIMLVGAVATLRDTNDILDLSFDTNSSELDSIRMRFLQFRFKIRSSETRGFGNRERVDRSSLKSRTKFLAISNSLRVLRSEPCRILKGASALLLTCGVS